jgi:hypothetical protein
MDNGISPKDIKLDMNKLLHKPYKTRYALDDIKDKLLDMQAYRELDKDVDYLIDILVDMVNILKQYK